MSTSPQAAMKGMMQRLLDLVMKHLMVESFRGLLGKCLAILSEPKAKGLEAMVQDSTILTVPVEILLEIIGHLDLHDKFHLSHVCRTTRALTRRDWQHALSQLSRNDKLDFWTGLAFIMPNYWACVRCKELHRRLDSDLPGWFVRDDDEVLPCPFSRSEPTPEMVPSTCYFYDMRHAHVQQAIKLTQRPQDDKDGYLDKLLRPYERIAVSPELIHVDKHLLVDLWADLRVVGGSCLSLTKYEFWVYDKEVSLEHLDLFPICPHMSIWQPMSVGPWPDSYLTRDCGLEGFMDDVHLALSTPGQEFSGHCSHCVTDYAAVAAYGKLLIKRWSDLGRYLSPLSLENQEFEARVSGFDRRLVEITVPHVPGSVRQRYVNSF